MRSLQHVLWRGAMALGLFVCGGAGVLALPHSFASACIAGSVVHAASTAVNHDAATRARC